MAAPDVFKSTIFERFFGLFDKSIDTNKDVDGKGTHERYQEVVGDSIDQELLELIRLFLPNTIEPQTLFEELIPHAEHLLGYDRKNQTLQLGETTEWHRRILAHMVRYYHIKGTKRCYELLFEIMGLTVEIEEFWPDNTFDSSDPDITFDTDDRPVLDIGKCTPCSRYEVTVIGGPPWDEIAAGVTSIIRFNEPINAYRGLLTYNGQEVDVTDGPQGDPCPVVDYDVTVVNTDNDAQTFEVEVTLAGSQPIDFGLGDAYYTVNNGPQIPLTGLGLGSTTNIGVTFDEGDEVRVIINNTLRPLCVVHAAMVTWLSPCVGPDTVDVTEGVPYVYVTIPDSALPLPAGFSVTTLRYSVNGLPQIEIPFTPGDANTAFLGPFYEGGTLEIWLNNDEDELCPYHLGPFELTAVPPSIMEETNVLDDCFPNPDESSWSLEFKLYDEEPGGPEFTPGMFRYRVNGGSWINYGVVTWGQTITIGPFNSGDELDVEVANVANPSNPWLFHDWVYTCPCDGANLFNDYSFPTPIPQPDAWEADFVLLPADQAGAVASTIPIGSKVFIYDMDSVTPGTSTLWEQNVGNGMVRVAMDHLDSDFDVVVLDQGRVVRDLQAVGTPFEYYQVADGNLMPPGSTGLYGGAGLSGKFAIVYLQGIQAIDPGPPGDTSVVQPYTLNLGFAMPWNLWDYCRYLIVQYSEDSDADTNPSATWVSLPLPSVPGTGSLTPPNWSPYIGVFPVDAPPTALFLRASWWRGGVLQGYSQVGPAA